MSQQQKDFDAMIAKVFTSAIGKQVLEHLENRYIKSPVCIPGSLEGQGYYREGQNSVIRAFKNAIIRQKMGAYKTQGDSNE
jgi:hypothetical protein